MTAGYFYNVIVVVGAIFLDFSLHRLKRPLSEILVKNRRTQYNIVEERVYMRSRCVYVCVRACACVRVSVCLCEHRALIQKPFCPLIAVRCSRAVLSVQNRLKSNSTKK